MNPEIIKLLDALPTNAQFLQIGVNNGQDWLKAFVLAAQWRGTMVDADLHYLDLAKQTYADIDARLTWFNCAVSDSEGTCTFYKVRDPINPDHKGIGSLDKEHILRHGVAEDNIDSFDVAITTVDKIVSTPFDLWVIDAEGAEQAILLGCNIDNIRPTYIILETTHMLEHEFIELASKLNYQPLWHPVDAIMISL